MKTAITQAFEESIRVKQVFLRDNIDALMGAVEAIVNCFQTGNKLFLFGNGGSAADAQHIAAEFVNRFLVDRPPLPAIALTTDSSILTSIANDYEYEQVFAKQLRALGKPGDVALAISTSGNSANVLSAVEMCRQLDIKTIGLTGGNGGKMAGRVDILLTVSAGRNSPRIQETHILVGHVICDIVDQRLFASK
ncbi:MAG TPA: D-sedoheptulose 7-phosphate isomerase [Candidatus Binatia bacterium]|nr:D-sedoheptulose 7-phosphate isomerase [Candidatus Binatia bacterium]